MGERNAADANFHADREQLDPIEAWARTKGVKLEVLPPELGVSGGLPLERRPSLKRAVEGVEEGRFAGIVVAYLSRLGRNLAEQLRVWDRVEAKGGRIVAIREAIDTSTAAGRLHRNLLASIDAHEREQHAERFDSRRRMATEAGIWQRRQTPRGYVKGDERRLVVDAATADEVRAAFRRARAGEPIVHIATGLKMTPSGVRQLLRNRVYLGELSVGDYSNPTAHPAIIDAEEFNAVQARLDAGIRPPRSNEAKGPALLAGLVRCASCGHVMTRTSGKGEGNYSYACPRNHSGDPCPGPAAIGASRLEAYVLPIATAQLERIKATATTEDRTALLRQELSDARRKRQGLLDTFDPDEIGADALASAVRKHSRAIEGLEEALQAELDRADALPTTYTGGQLFDDLSPRERNVVLRGLLAAVVVAPCGRGRRVPVAERSRVVAAGASLNLPRGRGGHSGGRNIVPIRLDPDDPSLLRRTLTQDAA
jgi:DNA invertase Pin-like site-specific DNA recombinase